MRHILSLCDYSGVWSQPYLDAGYTVTRVDIGYKAGLNRISERLFTLGVDITCYRPVERFWGILAAPSCTCFCRPGARWWPRMDQQKHTERDLALFQACYQICQQKSQYWWALENPPGRHKKLMPWLPPPAWQFQPWEYGDPWVKQTYIWGTAWKPEVVRPVKPEPTRRTPNGRSQGRIAFMSSSWKREREKTPEGFARAFFRMNP